jgi:hypothetical protein
VNRTDTNREALLARLASPDAYPQKLDLIRGGLLLIHMGEAAYRSSSFLDDRILGPATRGAWVPAERVVEAAAQLVDGTRPLHFIFHTGHVGSTLVSRLLDETAQVLSLREPLPLRTLAEAHDLLDAPESLLGPQQFDRLLETLLRLWRRGYAGTRAVVVKATSSAARLATVLLERSAGSRAIYLNLRADPALATLLAGANSLVDLRGHGPERLKRLSARLGGGIAPLHTLSPGELAAMSWLAESITRREALDRLASQVIAVDFDDFLGDVAGSMQRILVHFGLPADAAQLAQLAASPVLTRYSKAPEHDYGPAIRSAILADARRAHRDEIDRGMRWLERLAGSERAIAQVLDTTPVPTPRKA